MHLLFFFHNTQGEQEKGIDNPFFEVSHENKEKRKASASSRPFQLCFRKGVVFHNTRVSPNQSTLNPNVLQNRVVEHSRSGRVRCIVRVLARG